MQSAWQQAKGDSILKYIGQVVSFSAELDGVDSVDQHRYVQCTQEGRYLLPNCFGVKRCWHPFCRADVARIVPSSLLLPLLSSNQAHPEVLECSLSACASLSVLHPSLVPLEVAHRLLRLLTDNKHGRNEHWGSLCLT